MPTSLRTTISKDGRVRIPAAMLRRRGWVPGQQVDLVESGDSVTLRPAATPTMDEVRAGLARVAEVAGYTGPRLSVEDMNLSDIPYTDLYPDGP